MLQASLTDALGPESTVSKSTVSRICEAIRDEFDTWKTRDLSGVELDYFFADGSYFKMHPGACLLSRCSSPGPSPLTGKPVFLGLEPGFGREPRRLGLLLPRAQGRVVCAAPLLVISDGGQGLIGAAEVVFDRSLRQRCLIHRARNILAKAPVDAQARIKKEYWEIFDDIDTEPGPAAQAVARSRAKAFASKWRKLYPAAVDCLEDDFEHLVTYLRFPAEHHGRIRHSNFIERTFGETRRRVKVIGRLPGERSCLSLVWAVLDRASRGWRGVNKTIPSIRLLAECAELFDPIPIDNDDVLAAVTPAA